MTFAKNKENKVNFIVDPKEIEKTSMATIRAELGAMDCSPEEEAIILRAIHTSADFDYAKNLVFSYDAIKKGQAALKNGALIVTDTKMARAGINGKALEKLGCQVVSYIDDPTVSALAKEGGVTRSAMAVKHALDLKSPDRPLIFAVGNAPTALIELHRLIQSGMTPPDLIIGVPVGFVNVVEAKDLILSLDVPHIVAKGRKGGSNICAAIVNALLYSLVSRD